MNEKQASVVIALLGFVAGGLVGISYILKEILEKL